MARSPVVTRIPQRWALAGLIGLALLGVTRSAMGQEQDAPGPNFVIILADDMGYGDPHVLNPDSRIPTPHLDALATAGMVFTDAHTPSGVCTPTRYGLLTGRYCWRTRLKRGVLNGYSPHLMAVDRPTIASLLKARGYRTGIVGKWHLGLDYVRTGQGNNEFDFSQPVTVGPNTYGFDFSYIIPASLDFPPYLYLRNHEPVAAPTESQEAVPFPAFVRRGERAPNFIMEEVLDHLAGQASGYIQRAADDGVPFLLYFPLTAPHKPVLPHERFRGSTELGPYGDFIVQVDATVGSVLETLESSGVAENTVVIFTSDNGSFMYRRDDPSEPDHVDDETIQAYRSDRHRANAHWRGTKADIYEGGHHVPFFVRWPAAVDAGSACHEVICLTDILATVAELTGGSMPADSAEDSFSFVPLLQGKDWSRAPVVHHSASGMFAVRDGDWKLVLGNGSGGREAPRGQPFARPYQLFHVGDDPTETANVAAEHPDVTTRLERTLEDIRENGSR